MFVYIERGRQGEIEREREREKQIETNTLVSASISSIDCNPSSKKGANIQHFFPTRGNDTFLNPHSFRMLPNNLLILDSFIPFSPTHTSPLIYQDIHHSRFPPSTGASGKNGPNATNASSPWQVKNVHPRNKRQGVSSLPFESRNIPGIVRARGKGEGRSCYLIVATSYLWTDLSR